MERTRRRTIGERKSDDDDDDDYDFNPLHSRLSFDIITILDEISLTTTSLSLSLSTFDLKKKIDKEENPKSSKTNSSLVPSIGTDTSFFSFLFSNPFYERNGGKLVVVSLVGRVKAARKCRK